MNHQKLYQMLELPEEVIKHLNNYEESREFQLPEELELRLLSRSEWDGAVNELRTLLGEDSHGFHMLWEMLDIVCRYSYEQYRKKGISDEIFIDTMKFITRFLKWDKKHSGEYKFTQAVWFPRQISAIEFRVGALEYEFEEEDIAVHIPSDALFTKESVLSSLKDFFAFLDTYYPEKKGAKFTCDTWMLAPAMEELLNENSNILAFKHLFELDEIKPDADWFMSFIFPGHEGDIETLPENTGLQKRAKAYMLSGKQIGVAKGHIKEEILKGLAEA